MLKKREKYKGKLCLKFSLIFLIIKNTFGMFTYKKSLEDYECCKSILLLNFKIYYSTFNRATR